MTTVELSQMVADQSARAGITIPAVRVYQGPPNAFSCWIGHNAIFFSHRLLFVTPDAQIQAIVSHEIGHIVARDPLHLAFARLTLILVLLVGLWSGAWVSLGVCAILCWAAYMALIRASEFAADEYGARLLGTATPHIAWLSRRRGQPWYSLHPSPADRIRRLLCIENEERGHDG